VNLIALSAGFGILVAVFQGGWAAHALGIPKTGPITTGTPIILFAFVFGLSMECGVFLLSRIEEERDRTGDTLRIEATVVRLALVPAVMALAGERNWWMPAWLDGLPPRPSIGEPAEAVAQGMAGAEL